MGVAGFNEFQADSEIAFYTGILGLHTRVFSVELHSSRPSSGCIFSHTIPHLSSMGLYQHLTVYSALVYSDLVL